MFRERWQRQQSLEVDEGEASMVVEAATIRKLGLALPVLPIQVCVRLQEIGSNNPFNILRQRNWAQENGERQQKDFLGILLHC